MFTLAALLSPPLLPAAALAVFVVTYVVVAAQKIPFTRLDRPSAAMLGAVLIVALGILTPDEVYRHAISFDTLGLLLGMMVLAAYLAEAAFFRKASELTLKHTKTPRGLLLGTTVVCAALSALLVNDTVCVMVTPLVLRMVEDARLKPLPFLLAVAMGANVGSVATFTGNPQNMLVGQLSGLSYASYALPMTPLAAVLTLVCAAMLIWLFRKDLPREPFAAVPPSPPVDRPLMHRALFAFAAVVVAFFAGFNQAWSALAAASFLFLFGRRQPRKVLERVDFVLLVFFAGLFVVVHWLDATGWTDRMLEAFRPMLGDSVASQVGVFSFVTLVASNVVSNVPFVMLAGKWVPAFASPKLMWFALAMVSTLAGNLTLVGSVANLIVAECARDQCEVTFLDYLRAGMPVTLVTTALGVAALLAMHFANLL